MFAEPPAVTGTTLAPALGSTLPPFPVSAWSSERHCWTSRSALPASAAKLLLHGGEGCQCRPGLRGSGLRVRAGK